MLKSFFLSLRKLRAAHHKRRAARHYASYIKRYILSNIRRKEYRDPRAWEKLTRHAEHYAFCDTKYKFKL